jgi:hypothetical protein
MVQEVLAATDHQYKESHLAVVLPRNLRFFWCETPITLSRSARAAQAGPVPLTLHPMAALQFLPLSRALAAATVDLAQANKASAEDLGVAALSTFPVARAPLDRVTLEVQVAVVHHLLLQVVVGEQVPREPMARLE